MEQMLTVDMYSGLPILGWRAQIPAEVPLNLTEVYCGEGACNRDFSCTSEEPQVIEINSQSTTGACQIPFVNLARKTPKSDFTFLHTVYVELYLRIPHRESWLRAYHDPYASLYALPSCLCTGDLFSDGDHRLLVADLGTGSHGFKLKVFRGMRRQRKCSKVYLTGIETLVSKPIHTQ